VDEKFQDTTATNLTMPTSCGGCPPVLRVLLNRGPLNLLTLNPPVVELEVGELDILLLAYPLQLPKIQQTTS
jgi:hypothetical protein